LSSSFLLSGDQEPTTNFGVVVVQVSGFDGVPVACGVRARDQRNQRDGRRY